MLGNSLNLAVRLNLDSSNFLYGMDKSSAAILRMESMFGRWGGAAARAGMLVDRGVSVIANRYTALLGGLGAAQAIRDVMKLEARLTRLGTNASISAQEVGQLKDQIFAVASSKDIAIDSSQVLDAIDGIIEKTGDLQFAKDNILNIATAIQATGAEGSAIGEITAEFQKMGMTSKEVFQSMEILTVQGKAGAFTMKDLAALGPRVVTAYTALGRTGVPAIREMGAALQIIRQGTGSSEQAATTFENLLNTMKDPAKLKLLGKIGIKVYDEEQLKKGREVLKPINELMTDIIKKSGGKGTLLRGIFDEQAIKAFNAANAEFVRAGRMESLEKFYNVVSDGNVLIGDSARNARTLAAQMNRLSTEWQKFADAELAEPIGKLADALASLDSGTVDKWIKVGEGVAAAGLAWTGLKWIKKGAGAAKKVWNWVSPAVKTDAMGVPLSEASFGTRLMQTVATRAPWLAPALPYAGRALAFANPITDFAAISYYGSKYNSRDSVNPSDPWSTSYQDDLRAQVEYEQRRARLAAEQQRIENLFGGMADTRLSKPSAGPVDVAAELKISVSDDRVKVTKLRSNSPSLNMDVSTSLGKTMVMP